MEAQRNWTCKQCNDFLGQSFLKVPNGREDAHRSSAATASCSVCLGLSETQHSASMQHAIDKTCEPYGGMKANKFSVEQPPSFVLPGDVALRYHLAALNTSNAAPLSDFLLKLKAHLKTVAIDYVKSRQADASHNYPSCVQSEEQGYLCVHVVATPSSTVQRPSCFAVTRSKKRRRKRFRGHDPTEKQGGDPRQNLERRLCKQGIDLWSCGDVETTLVDTLPEARDELKHWFHTNGRVSESSTVEFHVAVWRRPFFLRGLYTKSRRDVSQTPFFVPSEENSSVMKRKGVTSVEEQINPVLAKIAGGISVLNNDPDDNDTVYSMIKFHASGREDLDVRMLLPSEPTANVGGRPFVCQVIDAFRVPTMEQIKEIPRTINFMDVENIAADENDDLARRRYGRSPLGVDISNDFSLVPSLAFKNLQGETEEKVKYYGCLCWCERELSSQEEFVARLGSFPLQLKQRTPIRVLHRRSNATRVRHVLTLRAKVVDEHHFRLNLSTDAGTYVKEFVHGDLGRTVPSIASLLGTKTDLLELDCEGIAGV